MMPRSTARPRFQPRQLLHGGDYNPEQWPRSVWTEDMALMRSAHWNVTTIGVFSWSRLEPEEGEYDFGWLDEVFSNLTENGMQVVLATPSAAPPAWLSRQYPETLRTGPDGVRRKHGNRVNYCWTSTIYRAKTKEIATRLAERYGSHPALALWHISNEYGGECACELCRQAFITWLRREFSDDLDRLNAAFWTTFWGHNYTDWDQIEIPGGPYGETSIQGLALNWKRFVTDQIVDFFLNESAPARRLSPHVPITTNLMGFYNGLNPWKLAPHLDLVSWDSYPGFVGRPMEPRDWLKVAMTHDLNRSLAKDRPFLLIESTPSSSNWYPRMTIKEPGVHMMEAAQAIAHGSDGVMYFQWRQSRGSQEKFHGAVVGHGDHGHHRVFREVAAVGQWLESIPEVAGTTSEAQVALIYDWESDWALEGSVGPLQGDKKYHLTGRDFYHALVRMGVMVDVIDAHQDLSGYRLVVAPMLYSVAEDTVERLKAFVEGGGHLLSTYLTAYVDRHDLVFEDGFLGPLREVFGVEVEEMDVLHDVEAGEVEFVPGNTLQCEGTFATMTFSEVMHARGAEVLAVHRQRFYAGAPAVTRNRYGQGEAVYLGARTESGLIDAVVESMVLRAGPDRLADRRLPHGVTVTQRGAFGFIVNSTAQRQEVSTRFYVGMLEPYESRCISLDRITVPS